MDPVVVGLVGIIILIVLFILGMPVGFAMAFVGFAGFSYLVSPSAGLGLLARDVFTNLSSYSLTVIPMFLLMGSIAFASGIKQQAVCRQSYPTRSGTRRSGNGDYPGVCRVCRYLAVQPALRLRLCVKYPCLK